MRKKKVLSFIIFILFISIQNLDVFTFILHIKAQLGDYIYPLDDTYIHLSISKNLSEYGIWGVTKYEFSSTSSSPLFTLLLATLINFFGNHPSIPLYFNIVLGNLLMLIIYINFKDRPFQLLFVYLGFILGVLLKVQMVSGMEHMLQLVIICSCWIYFYRWYQTGFTHKTFERIFYIAISLACITRYESLFFVTPLILFLLFSKKYKTGLFTILLAYIPIIVFGLYSISEGGHFFPNSVLVKGKHSFSLITLVQSIFNAKNHILATFYLPLGTILLLLLFSGNVFYKKGAMDSLKIAIRENLIYAIVFIALIGHLMFASTGWLYRYDAYLIALFVLSIAFAADKIGEHISYATILVSILFFLFLAESFKDRYQKGNFTLKYANKNIYDQQIQMARLVKKSFNNSTIVANDIGAITYFTDIKLYDLVGLGSTDILDMKKKHPDQFDYYINSLDYDLMMVYDNWFHEINFTNRNKIAQLIIQNNEICGGDVVNFYLPNESDHKAYTYQALEEFKKTIPADVQLNIIY